MPQYKSFRKKNRYKTLKYSHKNKRKNSHKNKYRVGGGPFMRFVNSFRSRARTHDVPNHSGPPPPHAEHIDEAMIARMYAFLEAEHRRLERGEEEAPPLQSPVLDIESERERERKIKSLLRETSELVLKIDLIHSTTMNNTNRNVNFYLYIQSFMQSLVDKVHNLIPRLASPDITDDSRIKKARSDLILKLDTTAQGLAAVLAAEGLEIGRIT